MMSASCLLTEEQLLCCICLDVFTSPVTLPCGHNFCKKCIMQHWDNNVQCQCPKCKVPFYRKLDLRVNTFISELASQFRQSLRPSNAGQLEANQGDIPCDICTENKMKAVKSCFTCKASYCEIHLKPHLTAQQLRRHQLVDPLENLEGRMCATHEKPLELFCRTDQSCVCMLCPVLDHKSHEVVSLKEQSELKKAELWKTESEIHRLIQERHVKLEELNYFVKLNKAAAEREMAIGTEVLTSLIRSLETAQAELIGSIEEKQRVAEGEAKGFIKELEQEISELIRKRADMEQLQRSKDDLRSLQSIMSLNSFVSSKDWKEVSMKLPYEEMVQIHLDQLEEKVCNEMKKLKSELDLKQKKVHEVDVTLDPETAHPALVLSADRKRVHHSVVKKNLPDNPRRFNPSCCVLAKEGFSSGRFYFEVGVNAKTRWTVGVVKESIKRKGVLPLCPENGHWTIWLKNGDEYAALVSSPLPLSLESPPKTVGVFVDFDEGLVSFYDADRADLLYSFTNCSFTGKIYPLLSPGLNNDGINSAPLTLSKCRDSKS
ncbi:E3 ubiquitin-protein ligase TRIM39-like [Aulostomus maculatus]